MKSHVISNMTGDYEPVTIKHYANRCPDNIKTSGVNQDLEEFEMFVGSLMNQNFDRDNHLSKLFLANFFPDTIFCTSTKNEAFAWLF